MLTVDLLAVAVFRFIMPEASIEEVIVSTLLIIFLLAASWLIPFTRKLYLRIDNFLERKGFFRWIFAPLEEN